MTQFKRLDVLWQAELLAANLRREAFFFMGMQRHEGSEVIFYMAIKEKTTV